MPQSYLKIDLFNRNKAEKTGGVTGSSKVKTENGTAYQLKPSILSAKALRRIKANGSDRENFGEVIAASVSRSITGSDKDDNTELVPEVSLVYDSAKQEVLVASRYLKDVLGTIDEYAQKNRKVATPKHHVKVSFTSEEEGTLYLGGEKDALLRKDLAEGLTKSIFNRDHDVNLGNMIVVKDKNGAHRIARIDFGHAFNDLLNAPKMVGGRVRNKDNQVLDFLNRETLSHVVKGKRIPKLWRDYVGIVPSIELAEAFKEMSKPSQDVSRGIENAKAQFSSLITELQNDPKGNKKVLDHIKKSLIAINNNVSDKISKKQDITDVLDQTFKNLEAFYTKGKEQMADAAKLMVMQCNVDKFIASPNIALRHEIEKAYTDLTMVHGIARAKGGIEWIKNDKDSKAFKGSLEEFIKKRCNDLKADVPDLQKQSPRVEQDVPLESMPKETTNLKRSSTISVPPQPLPGVLAEYNIENIKFKYIQTADLGVNNTQSMSRKLPISTINETVEFMKNLSPLDSSTEGLDIDKESKMLKNSISPQSSDLKEQEAKFNEAYATFCAAAHAKVHKYHAGCSAYFTAQLDNKNISEEAREKLTQMRAVSDHCAQVASNDKAININIAIQCKAMHIVGPAASFIKGQGPKVQQKISYKPKVIGKKGYSLLE